MLDKMDAKISDVIKALEKVLDEYGDLPVFADEDYSIRKVEVEDIEVNTGKNGEYLLI